MIRLRRKRISLLVVFAVLVFSYNNCSRIDFGGQNSQASLPRSLETVVGNPLVSKSLVSHLCNVITRCNAQVSTIDCETGVLAATGVDYQLGLPKGFVSTFADIVNAEVAGSLQSNATGYETCKAAVDSLSCADPVVQGAYSANSAAPFAAVANMIPTSPGSCPATFAQPVARNEYYVSTLGNDLNDGSQARPWATITAASQKLSLGAEGAIVHVAAGSYSFTPNNSCISPARPCSVVTTASGTGNAPITYISDQQWAAKILPGGGANTAWYNSGDHVKIIGFEIAGTADTEFGILSEGAFSQLIGNHIHDIPVAKNCAAHLSGGGIYFGGFTKTHDTDAIGNLIHDIGPVLNYGLPAASYCRFANGINVEQTGGKIQNNILYHISSSGVETWNMASNLQISHNLIFGSGHRTDAGLPIGGAVLLGSDPALTSHTGTTVSNNIFRNNSGFALNEVSVSGNNAYLNNLIFANTVGFNITSGITPTGTITIDPLMIDFRIDGSGNHRLQVGSPAIDAGTLNCLLATGAGNCTPSNDFAGFARPNGAGLDIGPYEWH